MDEKSIKWSQLNPRDCIQVTQQVWLTQRELQFVTQLYVPFLGVQASTLYLVLFSELSPNSYQSDVIQLADLLALKPIAMKMKNRLVLNIHLNYKHQRVRIYFSKMLYYLHF